MSSELSKRLHRIQVDLVLKQGLHDDLINNRIALAEGKPCPLCIKRGDPDLQGTMRKMVGRYGSFLGCTLYPHCKFSWNSPLLEKRDSVEVS
jgi:ssDNA-binding Zn-finger/Zn-ribbon topoisomerase 1